MWMWLRAGVLAGCVALTAAAVDWKARRPEGYVTDSAHVIDLASRNQIDHYCAAVEQATGAKLALVIVASLEREPATDVARALYEGSSLGDRGLLVLLSRNDRRHAIYAGRAFVPRAGLASDILREMRPALLAANYPEALMAAAETAGNAIARAEGVRINASLPRRMHPSVLDGAWWAIGALLVAAAAFVLLRRGARGFGHSRSRGAGGFGGFDSSDGCGGFGGGSRQTRASDW